MSNTVEQKNKKTLRSLLLLVVLMFVFALALIPLYDILCDITGINGKTKQDSPNLHYTIDTKRIITLEFITSVASGTRLSAKADHYEVKAHPGEVIMMAYTISNNTKQRMLVKANPSVTPGPSVSYVKNTHCFCFENQVFKAGETKHLTMQLVVDPNIPEHYKRLTFGFTFFDITKKFRG